MKLAERQTMSWLRAVVLSLSLSIGLSTFARGVEIVIKADVAYGKDAAQRLDVHVPKGVKDAPVMVFVHGGGWRRGDKAGAGSELRSRFFAERGWIYVSVNYRLSPGVMHPVHAEDVARALAFVHNHAAEWGGDASHLYVSGHSAGAHLASLVALNERFLKAAGTSGAMLRGVVLLDTAAYDLEAIMQKSPDAASPYPSAFGKDPAVWRDASPVAHIVARKGVPPFLLVLASGGADKAQRCEEMAAKLRGIDVRAEILDASRLRNHGTLNREFGAADDPVAPKVLTFLESVRTGQAKTLGARETLDVDADVAAKVAAETEAIRIGQFIKRSDKNGDGKWSPDETPALFRRRFDALDTNKDGFLDADEVGAPLKENRRKGSEMPAEATADSAPTLSLAFTKDYFPGTMDRAGKPLVGTETMNFAVHRGKLFAGLGNRNLPEDAPLHLGAQVIVKESAEGAWSLDHQFPTTSPRINALISATFRTDANGQVLEPPVTMLVAGPSDHRAVEEDAPGQPPLRWATAWTRDDKTSAWTETRVYSADRRRPACRAFCMYQDPVTKVSHLFAGASHGSIHRAVYAPDQPGRLRWAETPELTGTGRVVAFAECNGILYASCGLRRTRDEGIAGGLYRRINGANPKWECVYRWPWPQRRGGADEAFLMRGLSAVKAPDGKGEVLLGVRAQAGVVERIDPRADHAATRDFGIREHFAKLWGLPQYRGAAISAYNRIGQRMDNAASPAARLAP